MSNSSVMQFEEVKCKHQHRVEEAWDELGDMLVAFQHPLEFHQLDCDELQSQWQACYGQSDLLELLELLEPTPRGEALGIVAWCIVHRVCGGIVPHESTDDIRFRKPGPRPAERYPLLLYLAKQEQLEACCNFLLARELVPKHPRRQIVKIYTSQ